MKTAPIGMFDSGLGGLSVWLEIVKTLPYESIVYFADSGNCPYGSKSKAAITKLSQKIVEFLIEKGCKIIVIACNTATAAAIDFLRNHYPAVTFVGMEPAVKPAASRTQTGHIGVLATKGTLESQRFRRIKNRYAADVHVHPRIGTGLVQAVENQEVMSQATEQLVRKYIEPMLQLGVDKIVLGCTHYPFLMPVFQKIIPETVEIIDPAPAVALQTKRLLENLNLIKHSTQPPDYQFFTTGDALLFERFLNHWKIPFSIIEKAIND